MQIARKTARPILPSPFGPFEPLDDEADLPAQEAQARSDPRLPSPQLDALRAGDPQAPAPEGPQAPHPLTLADDEGSPDPRRRRRLSRSGDFDRVYREGTSKGNRFLVVYSFARSEDDRSGSARLGISVGRRIGKAVQRNKVKRAVREAFWALADDLPPEHDYVIVGRAGIEDLVAREGSTGVRDSLAELIGPAEERLS